MLSIKKVLSPGSAIANSTTVAPPSTDENFDIAMEKSPYSAGLLPYLSKAFLLS